MSVSFSRVNNFPEGGQSRPCYKHTFIFELCIPKSINNISCTCWCHLFHLKFKLIKYFHNICDQILITVLANQRFIIDCVHPTSTVGVGSAVQSLIMNWHSEQQILIKEINLGNNFEPNVKRSLWSSRFLVTKTLECQTTNFESSPQILLYIFFYIVLTICRMTYWHSKQQYAYYSEQNYG